MQTAEHELIHNPSFTPLPNELIHKEKKPDALNFSPLSKDIIHGNDPESEAFVQALLKSMQSQEPTTLEQPILPPHEQVPMAIDQQEVQKNLTKPPKMSFWSKIRAFFSRK